MNQEKEESFFKKLIISIKNIEKYPELASKTWGAVLWYIIKLLAIFTIVVSFCSVYQLAEKMGQGIEYIRQDIPNFYFQNNMLKMETETPVIIEKEDNLFSVIIVDTNTKIQEETYNSYKEKLKNATNGIIFLENKLMVKTNMQANGIVEYDYATIAQNYQIQNFNKQELLQYFSGTNLVLIYLGMFFITFIYMEILYFTSIWLDVILLGTFGYVAALFMRLRLRFSAMCKMAIHALTLPILLNAIVILVETFTGFQIKYFEIMYIGIACIYIVATILMIKSDVIKSKQELAKIIEEQAKVKMEIDRQKEEEERQKEEQKREKEREKQKQKKKKESEDKNVGNEPQGENA